MTVYCIVPRALGAEAHESVRAGFRDDPGIVVIVERRGAPSPHRAFERRARVEPVASPSLPRAIRRYAPQLVFVAHAGRRHDDDEDREANRLAARARDGDVEAVAELYMRYFDPLYAYLHVVLRDADEAESLTQQVFAQAIAALPRFEVRADATVRAWLFRIARNEAMRHLRKHRRVHPEPPERVSERRDASAVHPQPLELVTDAVLLSAVERLPLAQRQALALRFILDLDNDEIASVLDMRADNVRQLQSRALRTLERRLLTPARDHSTLRLMASRTPSGSRKISWGLPSGTW